MSVIDAYEYERRNGRVQRRKPYQTRKKSHKREVQLSMKLYGDAILAAVRDEAIGDGGEETVRYVTED